MLLEILSKDLSLSIILTLIKDLNELDLIKFSFIETEKRTEKPPEFIINNLNEFIRLGLLLFDEENNNMYLLFNPDVLYKGHLRNKKYCIWYDIEK